MFEHEDKLYGWFELVTSFKKERERERDYFCHCIEVKTEKT